MSTYTATVSATRGLDKVRGSYPMTGVFEDFPSPTDTPVSYTRIFENVQCMETFTGSHFGTHNALAAAVKNQRKRAFCWTPGTNEADRYISGSFWEDSEECPARSLFVEVDGRMTRVIFRDHAQLETYVSGKRVVALSKGQDSKLLMSRWKGETIGKPALLTRGVKVLNKPEAQSLTTGLEAEVALPSAPTGVVGTFRVPVSWKDKIEEWKTNGTDVHISVMPDN